MISAWWLLAAVGVGILIGAIGVYILVAQALDRMDHR